MRTTVTLDSDVERLLKDAAHQTRRSFKETLNGAVRRGLAVTGAKPTQAPFAVQARPMGVRAGIDAMRLGEQANDQEIDAFLDLTRKLLDRERSGS